MTRAYRGTGAYFRLDNKLDVVEIADGRKNIDGDGRDPSIWSRQPGKPLGAGWIERWDFPDFEFVTRLAASASRLTGGDWIPVDQGPNQSPRFDVMVCPKVGDDVSKGFNGDYYPIGKVASISAGPTRRVITVDGPRGKLRFYRRGLSSGWIQAGGTWGLVRGIVDRYNQEF